MGVKSYSRAACRLGGLRLHVLHDSDKIAARARRGLDARFEREALALDPSLSGDALARKVALIRRAHMQRMALASVRARQANTARNTNAAR